MVGIEPRSSGRRAQTIGNRVLTIRYLTTSPDAGFGRDRDKDEFQTGVAAAKKIKAAAEAAAAEAAVVLPVKEEEEPGEEGGEVNEAQCQLQGGDD